MNDVDKEIFITEPLLPDINKFNSEIAQIFKSK